MAACIDLAGNVAQCSRSTKAPGCSLDLAINDRAPLVIRSSHKGERKTTKDKGGTSAMMVVVVVVVVL
ncbi:MAG: hypothetical protein CMI26_07430 [Opitutae bacterium]|nr:hypothetical protein [Opitutae bacterium]|tara:strand:+ start:1305 stop:1508 length:204 start_codon:yes stop_codon:yes gene_type:complete